MLVETLRNHRCRDEIGDARRRFAGAEKQDRLVLNILAGDAQRRKHAGQCDRRGALDVVVEHACAIAIFLKQPECVLIGEVLELDDHARKHLLCGGHEFVHELVVDLAAHPALAQAHVKRIGEQRAVVGTHVDRHREAERGMYAGARGVERELADGYAHPVRAEIAETQNALAVGDHDEAGAMRPVAQHFRDVSAVVRGDENAARPLENHAVLLAREAHAGRIDDGLHLVDVIDDHAEEQRLVAVVQRIQRNVFFKRVRQALQRAHEARDLLFLR